MKKKIFFFCTVFLIIELSLITGCKKEKTEEEAAAKAESDGEKNGGRTRRRCRGCVGKSPFSMC